MEAVFADPLYYLRTAAEERFGCGLYLLDLPEKLVGFSCFLDDSQVPGTKEYADAQKQSEEMLKALDLFERDAFSTASQEMEEKK